MNRSHGHQMRGHLWDIIDFSQLFQCGGMVEGCRFKKKADFLTKQTFF